MKIPRRQTGFTLLEILVVLILLGIILSVAVLSTGGVKERELEQEVQRMVRLIQLAKEEAVLKKHVTDTHGERRNLVIMCLDIKDLWYLLEDFVQGKQYVI